MVAVCGENPSDINGLDAAELRAAVVIGEEGPRETSGSGQDRKKADCGAWNGARTRA
jgi:hypothetical protein